MSKLSDVYAASLFELASEDGALDEAREQAAFLIETLKDPEYRGVLAHPRIPAAEKDALLRDAYEGRIYGGLLGLLRLMAAKNRETHIASVLTAFVGRVDVLNGKTEATVISATELRDGQKAALKAELSKKLNKHVDITARVDPSVIGGFYIQVDGYFIDRTTKKRLRDMKVLLKKECGA